MSRLVQVLGLNEVGFLLKERETVLGEATGRGGQQSLVPRRLVNQAFDGLERKRMASRTSSGSSSRANDELLVDESASPSLLMANVLIEHPARVTAAATVAMANTGYRRSSVIRLQA